MIQWVIAPLVLCFSGFHTTHFLLSGLYTWPRTSRVIALTLAASVLTYEFVYKAQLAQTPQPSGNLHLKAVLYSCIIPYVLGSLALLTLIRL